MLELSGVTKHYKTKRGIVQAVENVSFSVTAKQTLALVGESGCGKTTIAKMILQLERPTSGKIMFEGADITTMSRRELKSYRRQVQAVFQDPYSSLNPRMRVGRIISEPILAHERPSRSELSKRIEQVLEIVGLPATAAKLYPHEFSGGQRQRIAIARALALQPRMMVLDEPVSALDVSIRAQILNLLQDIQEEFGLTYFIIAHDLALVEHFSHEVAVVYLGGVAEAGPTRNVFSNPQHPYTQALLAAVPLPDPDHILDETAQLGEIASALKPPPGCTFNPRCPFAFDICRQEVPRPYNAGERHVAACHLLAPGAKNTKLMPL